MSTEVLEEAYFAACKKNSTEEFLFKLDLKLKKNVIVQIRYDIYYNIKSCMDIIKENKQFLCDRLYKKLSDLMEIITFIYSGNIIIVHTRTCFEVFFLLESSEFLKLTNGTILKSTYYTNL